MPRRMNPELEGRVLEAARNLWHRGGEKALTMRKVAKLAKTNPPALYRRFRDRDDILKALVESYQTEFLEAVEPSQSIPEFARRLLETALERPREFELFMWVLRQKVTKSRPVVQLFLKRCAETLGGSPEDHLALALVLGSLVRGTIIQMLDGQVPATEAQTKAAYLRAVDVLVANEGQLRGPE
jgi:AcrR family transcriptional regulator